MTEKRTYRFSKLLKLTVALAIVAGVLVLSVSAVGGHEKQAIADIRVAIKSPDEQAFISKEEILAELHKVAGKNLRTQAAGFVDLLALEEGLAKHRWVKKAELYIDNKNVLHVNIQSYIPVVRVFSHNGTSFYLSEDGYVLPLNERVVTRLPVFTGFAGDPSKLNARDSVLLTEVQTLARFISNNAFWMSQIEQTDITASGHFEMIPKMGNQLIRFGDADRHEEKFRKLLAFYNQVMMKTGWNKYSVIDLQYDGQVVAERRHAAEIKADSLAAIRIMRSIVEKARKNADDSTSVQLPERQSKASVQGRPVINTPSQADETIPEAIPEVISTPPRPDERKHAPKAIMKPAGSTDAEVITVSEANRRRAQESSAAAAKREAEAQKQPAGTPGSGSSTTNKQQVKEKTEKKVPKAVMPRGN